MGNVALSNLQKVGVGGDNMCYLADVTMSASYATSGDTFPTTSGPLGNITDVIIKQKPSSTYALEYDATAGKVLAYAWTTLTQVSAATDLSAVTTKALIYGRS